MNCLMIKILILKKLLSTEKPVVKKLMMHINQLSLENIKAQGLDDDRIKHLSNYVGIFNDLKIAMKKECFKPFFNNLEIIMPHHLRVSPVDKMAETIIEELNQIKKEENYKFKIIF